MTVDQARLSWDEYIQTTDGECHPVGTEIEDLEGARWYTHRKGASRTHDDSWYSAPVPTAGGIYGKRFGGAQEGAGRPALPPDKKAVQREISFPPDVLETIVGDVGDGRGAVARKVIEIVRAYYAGGN